MHIRFFGFKPPVRILAMGDVGDTHFELSAIAAGDHMEATLRFALDDRTAVKIQLPNDVTEGSLPTYIRAALATLYAEERAA